MQNYFWKATSLWDKFTGVLHFQVEQQYSDLQKRQIPCALSFIVFLDTCFWCGNERRTYLKISDKTGHCKKKTSNRERVSNTSLENFWKSLFNKIHHFVFKMVFSRRNISFSYIFYVCQKTPKCKLVFSKNANGFSSKNLVWTLNTRLC